MDLTTSSFQALPWGDRIIRILLAALEAVEPGAAVRRWMTRREDALIVCERKYSLNAFQRVYIVGIGKAAVPMGAAAAVLLDPYLTGGIILTKDGYAKNLASLQDLPGIKIIEASHPIPDVRGLNGARLIAELLTEVGEGDLVVCLISGGSSALLPLPAEGITLADLQELTSTLLACGASINEINTLRKHLDTLKGGGLARLAAPASLITLVLSDVVDDLLDVIASGPSVPDPTTFADAYSVLEQYRIVDRVPAPIKNHLLLGMQGNLPDTPKPGDVVFERVYNVVVGSNRLAADAALHQALREGFQPMLLTTSMQGEARQAGRMLGAIAKEIVASGNPLHRPACVIAGGETTVTIHGNGKGGRNQELALGGVQELAGLENVVLVTLATDGGDGPTDAAGAVVTGDTLKRAQLMGIDPADFLTRNDAYHFFSPLGDLLKPGPTDTNVNDLALILVK
jgi:glycerate 2-kinase